MASLDPRHILRHRVCRRSYVAHASAPRKLSDACREYRIDLCHRTVGFRECPQQTVWDKEEYLIGGRAATSRSRARGLPTPFPTLARRSDLASGRSDGEKNCCESGSPFLKSNDSLHFAPYRRT